jgi:fructan beta-fructosidase
LGPRGSTDLLHWHNLPVAIPEQPAYMVYSGSAVVDWNNTSGLCQATGPQDHSCLIAIFTAATYDTWQRQHLAFSNDRGRTWTEYSGNPVADLKAKDFRDPKVFWYAPQKKWVMVGVLADERQVRFLNSTNLRQWTVAGAFGPEGDSEGQWECPDLFELPIEGSQEKRWVLIISRNPGAPNGGTGVRYLVGNFDGSQFTPETAASTKLWADYGKDFYATETFSDVPASDGRRIFVGWMSNWQYANLEPTELWRGAQSFPRELKLRRYADGLRMVQKPVREIQSLRGKPFSIRDLSIADANQRLAQAALKGDTYEIEAELTVGGHENGFHLRQNKEKGVQTIVGITADSTLVIDRIHSGDTAFNQDFPGRHTAKLHPSPTIKLHIFVDRSSVEVFANDGDVTMTERIYPPPGSDGLELYTSGGGGKVLALTIWKLQSVWH